MMHDITGVVADSMKNSKRLVKMTNIVYSLSANDLHNQVTPHNPKHFFGTSFSSVSEAPGSVLLVGGVYYWVLIRPWAGRVSMVLGTDVLVRP